MTQLSIWLMASRPKTLIATASPVLIGTSLAFSQGSMKFWVFFCCLFAALFVQIGTNLVNDYFDGIRGTDNFRVGPVRVTAAGLVSHKHMRIAIFTTFIIGSLLSGYLILIGGVPIAIIGCLCIFFGIFYTAGPLPLGYIGLGDVFAFLFCGPIATATTYYLQTNEISFLSILSGFIPGCFSCAVLAINNLRDQKQDQIAGKNTLVVRLGTQFGKNEYLTCLAIPYVLCGIFAFHFIWVSFIYVLLFTSFALVEQLRFALKANDYLTLFPKTTILFTQFTILFCLGIILS